MPQAVNLVGKKFNKLTALERDFEIQKIKKSKDVWWKCQCDCGNIISVNGKTLRAGKIKSCGCEKPQYAFKDLTGQRFGRLIILEKTEERKNNSIVWKCQCDCGNICFKDSHSLNKGSTKSCGCLVKDNAKIQGLKNAQDISGQQFGHLTALYQLDEIQQGSGHFWVCQCDCGNIKKITIHNLKSGRTTSCGCIKASTGETNLNKKLQELNINFITEKTYSDLISNNQRKLKFDFYLPDYNILIEFDGEQHYLKNRYSSKDQFERDCQKNKYCLNNNIPLYRIPYSERDNILDWTCLTDILQDRFKVKYINHYNITYYND